MSNNCLVEKLKSVVNNDDLVKINCCKFTLKANSNVSLHITDATDVTSNNTVTPYSGGYIALGNGLSTINIQGKYDVTGIGFEHDGIAEVDLNSFKGFSYMDNVMSFYTMDIITGSLYQILKGDVGALSGFKNIQQIICGFSSINDFEGMLNSLSSLVHIEVFIMYNIKNGDITTFDEWNDLKTLNLTSCRPALDVERLGNKVKLETLVLDYSTSAYGELANLATSQVGNGRNSGTLVCKAEGSHPVLTCNGSNDWTRKTINFYPISAEHPNGYEIL